jgi:cytochrome c oxidase subunit 4
MEPVVAPKKYVLAMIALLSMTVFTTSLSLLDMGVLNMVLPLAVAVLKALIVAGVFMHALYDFKLVRVILGAGVLWFLILITLTLSDYLTRGWGSMPLQRPY